MKNPFVCQSIATGPSFCGRHRELTELVNAVQGSHNVLLLSPRNFGKTSLIHKAFDEIHRSKPKTHTLYVDLEGSISGRDFCKKAYESLNQIETNPQRLGRALNRSRMIMSADAETGKPGVTPFLEAVPDVELLNDLMELVKRYSEKHRMVIAFEGFQEVGLYEQGQFAKKIRSHIQGHHRIAYIFSGNQRHRLIKMFNHPSSGLYRMANNLSLSNILAEDYSHWMVDLFRDRGIELPDDFTETVVRRFAHHPFYIQAFLRILWERLPSSTVKPAMHTLMSLSEQIEKELIAARKGEFEAVWEGLTINQKKALKLIMLSEGQKVFSTQNLSRAELSAPQIANRALISLIQKEILTKDSIYSLTDIGFRKWLQPRICI